MSCGFRWINRVQGIGVLMGVVSFPLPKLGCSCLEKGTCKAVAGFSMLIKIRRFLSQRDKVDKGVRHKFIINTPLNNTDELLQNTPRDY